MLRAYRVYEAGFKCYLNGDWDGCIKYMQDVIRSLNDPAAKVLKERAENFKANPPAKWTGVYVYDKK